MDNSVDDYTRGSKFNAAQLKMIRLDNFLTKVAMCDQNLQAMDLITNKYNFELKFNCLDSLMKECLPLVREEQQEESVKLRNAIKNAVFRKDLIYNNKGVHVIDKLKFKNVEDALDYFERHVRNLMHQTKMDTPMEDEFSGYD